MGDPGHSLLLLLAPAGSASIAALRARGWPAFLEALEKLEKPRLVGGCFAVLCIIHVCGLCGIYVLWIVLREVLTEAQLLKLEANLGETEKK